MIGLGSDKKTKTILSSKVVRWLPIPRLLNNDPTTALSPHDPYLIVCAGHSLPVKAIDGFVQDIYLASYETH